MPLAKPWKLDAIVRLFVSVFICIFSGSLVISALHYASRAGKANLQFYPLLGAALVCLGTALFLLRKPWRFENLKQTLGVLMACFYSGLLLGMGVEKMAGTPKPSVAQMVITVLSFQGATLLLVWRFVREHEMTWTEAFGFGHRWQQAMLGGVILAGLFLPVGFSLQILSAKFILPHLHLHPEEQQAVQTLQMAGTWGTRLILGVITILLVPPAEELLFRGVLYAWGKQMGYRRLALWGTSLLFGAIHLNLVTFLPLTVLALGLAMVYDLTENLLAPITAHAVFNAVNFSLLYLVQDYLSKG